MASRKMQIKLCNGKFFENSVKNLLSLQGWAVQDEQIIGHMKVDAYAEKPADFGDITRIAVECKHYSKKLSKAIVTKLFATYLPLIQGGLIDYVLLVTEQGLHPSAETFCKSVKGLKHFTESKLLSNVIDFNAYVAGLYHNFELDEIRSYYVPQKVRDLDVPIEDFVLSRLDEEFYQPIAILGGYGMGKSTLARSLAYNLSRDYIDNKNLRIPILISLDGIAHEQTLDGLLGTLFTSKNAIPNYNFELFMALNRAGKFVIILDGFDEMKNVMSWEHLKYNLNQLYRLIVPGSKVLLLGRPTAFLTENEQNEALHGVSEESSYQKTGEKRPTLLDRVDWPDFKAVYIDKFSRDQIIKVVRLYALQKSLNIDSDELKEKYLGFSEAIEITDSRVYSLAMRPVQLNMLLEIIPSFEGNINDLTVSELYSNFTELVMVRELSKSSRQAFSLSVRLRFLQRLAFYMWQDGQRKEINAYEIPLELYKDIYDGSEDLEAVKRDLLTGSFLERSGSNGFSFSHKSFQEFLVAEHLVNLATSKSTKFLALGFLTAEIEGFFIELIGAKSGSTLAKWLRQKSRVERSGVEAIASSSCIQLVEIMCEYYGLKPPHKKDLEQASIDQKNFVRRIIETDILNERYVKKSKITPSRPSGAVTGRRKPLINKKRQSKPNRTRGHRGTGF